MPGFTSPKHNSRFWDKKNAEDSVRQLYDEMTEARNVPIVKITIFQIVS